MRIRYIAVLIRCMFKSIISFGSVDMISKSKMKLITILSVFLIVVAMLCQTIGVVFAKENDEDVILYIENNKSIVAESEIDPDENFIKIKVLGTTDAIDMAKAIVDLAKRKKEIQEEYTKDYLDENFETYKHNDRQKAEKWLNELYDAIIKITAENIGSNWETEYNNIIAEVDKKLADIEKLRTDAINAFEDYKKAAASGENSEDESVKTTYENIKKLTENRYVELLDKTYADYINSDGCFVNDISYSAKDSKDCYKEVDELKAAAIKALESVPKNPLDEAYNTYMKCNASKEITAAQKKILEDGVKYFDRADTSVRQNGDYVSKNASIVKFLDNTKTDPQYNFTTDYLEDEDGIVTIKASKDVFKTGWKLFASPGYNAQMRNATHELKNLDKNLAVAYVINIHVVDSTYGNEYVDERNVNYTVTIDLENFIKHYNKADNLKNIQDMAEFIKDKENLSLCYFYDDNKIENINDCKLEEGKLVFTTSTLNTQIYVSGTGIDTLIANPLFWLGLLVVIILIVIIIKIIAKQFRYSIKFITNGGSKVKKVRAAKNEYFVMPKNPTREGYIFGGWFVDEKLTERFIELRKTKRGNIKLYAKWVTRLNEVRLVEIYEKLRNMIRSCQKVSFKPIIGLSENELLAIMKLKDDHVELNLALDPKELRDENIKFVVGNNEEVPVRLDIASEDVYAEAVALVDRMLKSKGLQKIDDYENAEPMTADERKNGFAYAVHNEKVAETCEDYVDLMRIALKSYIIDQNNNKFKEGDKITLARAYVTNEIACLHLPLVDGDEELGMPSDDKVYDDTPVVFRVTNAEDMKYAYRLIDRVMVANGFIKCPENANNIEDVEVPATCGFAFTLKF